MRAKEIGSTHFGTMARQYGDLLKTVVALWEGGGFNEKGRSPHCA
ncbi:MAG: hypothetical protein R2932_33440 [Caldilineaceae bacterium]